MMKVSTAVRYRTLALGMALAAGLLGSCALFHPAFPSDLQGIWEHESAFYSERFIIDGSELYYVKQRIAGSITDERTMYLVDYDEPNSRFRTTVFYFSQKREGEQLFFAFAEGDYPAEPEWMDVHLH